VDFVVAVRVFKPFRCFVDQVERIPHSHDILMLGGHSLSALRDKITCLADEVVLSEAQGDPQIKMKVSQFSHYFLKTTKFMLQFYLY